MKNMSFGKMVGIFAGFLILIVIVAVVILKMNQKNAPSKQLTTKTYKHRDEQQDGAEAPTSAQAAPPIASPATTQGATPSTNQMLGLTPPQQPQVAATNTPVDVGQRLANIDASLSSLDARVSALEGNKRATDTAKAPGRKSNSQRTAHVAIKKPASEDKEKSLSEMPGYKSMAVVSNRAWVSAPDGTEDSVTKGEPIPRARVRSMNTENGVVITTTDQRIEPIVEQRTVPERHARPRTDLH